MDTDELLTETIAELRETLRALLDTPHSGPARQRAARLLGIELPEPVPDDDPRRWGRRGRLKLFKTEVYPQ